MALYLVQHGKSLSRDQDPEKGLSAEGMADVERIAGVAEGYGVRVTQVRHSGKKRARQTAEIFAASLKPPSGIAEMAGIMPLDDVTALTPMLSGDDNVMIVGHLPFMERLTSHLITGSAEKPVFRFQNGGIVCLEQDAETRFWFIKWTLMPNIG